MCCVLVSKENKLDSVVVLSPHNQNLENKRVYNVEDFNVNVRLKLYFCVSILL